MRCRIARPEFSRSAAPLLICIGGLIKSLGQSFKSGDALGKQQVSAGRLVVQRDTGKRQVSDPAALALRRGCFPKSRGITIASGSKRYG
jgi:hypothetical protein